MAPDMDSLARSFDLGQYHISKHGFEEMGNDGITVPMLERALGDDDPEIIEDYPENCRGASCLILGWCSPNEWIHVCVGYAGTLPVVITAYRPGLDKFQPGFRRRRQK